VKPAPQRFLPQAQAVAPWPKQRWEEAVEALVRDAAEQETRAGTSWLRQHRSLESVSFGPLGYSETTDSINKACLFVEFLS
jgi:hypothetical protein